MTYPSQPPRMSLPAYADYQARENAARNQYLSRLIDAHHEYLTGPFPDRDAYDAVDRSAWVTYHTICRRIWQEYQQQCQDATDQLAYGLVPATTGHLYQADPVAARRPRPANPTHPYPTEDDSWLSR